MDKAYGKRLCIRSDADSNQETSHTSAQAITGSSIRNVQNFDLREANIQGASIVGVQGVVNQNNYYNTPPAKQCPDENSKVAAIEKHQHEHLNGIPESVVPYDKAVKQSNLPVVYPGMHDYKAYGEEELLMEDKFVSSTQQEVVDLSYEQPVYFDEILNLASTKKFIALIGPPGSGKTTLSKRLAKLSQPNQSAKFLLRFMDLSYDDRLSYKQLFIDYLCPELDEETKEHSFQWICQNPDKCVFVFDGYDQATWSLENTKPLNVSYDTPLQIKQLVANLCNKKFFKESLLIFTSRPHTILKIPSDLRPDVTVHVDDLSTDDMIKLFKAFAGENADELWEILTTKGPQLFSLGHNPLLLQFIIFAIIHQGLNQVNTITEVFQVVLEHLRYSENARGTDIKQLWKPLGKMAYEGMLRETVVFTIKNLTDENLDATVVQDVVISFVRNIGFPTQRLFDGDQLFYFSHQMLQEMLAAKYISDYMPDEEYPKVLEQVAEGGHWSMVRRFLCGFLLKAKNETERSSTLLHLLTKKLENSQGADLLELVVDLQECSEEVVDLCAKHVPAKINFAAIPISLSAAHALSQILPKLDQTVERLDLQHCNLKSDAMKWICEGILKMKHEIKDLVLGGNQMEDDGLEYLTTCMEKMEKLGLAECDITSNGVQVISRGLKKLAVPMKTLDLRQNKIGERGVMFLSSDLDKMETLELSDSISSSEEVQILAEGIQKRAIPLKKLSLSGHVIGDKGVEYLVICFDKLEVLVLFDCNITSVGVCTICKGLKALKNPMKLLGLGENQIGDDGVGHLSACLDRIKILSLPSCDITSTGFRLINEGLTRLSDPMEELDLSNNEVEDEGISHLTCNFDKMEKLVLASCNITSIGVEKIADGLKKLVIPMKELDLSNNEVGDEGIGHLTCNFDKMEKLMLGSCSITSIGVQKVADGLKKLVTSMKELELSDNTIEDEGAKHLTDCVDKIKKLILGRCEITDVGKQAIYDALQNYNLPSSTVDFEEDE